MFFLHIIRIAIIPYYRIRSKHNTNTHETNYKLKLPQILSKREETEDREEHGIALKEVRSKSLCLLSGKETFIRRVGKKLQQCVCVFVAVWVYLSLSLFVSVCVCVCVCGGVSVPMGDECEFENARREECICQGRQSE